MTTFNTSEAQCLRRKIAAVAIIALVLIAVGTPGVAVLLDPLKHTTAPWQVVTTLDRIPSDGTPKLFPVTRSQRDAWASRPTQTLGSVYLRRLPDSEQIVAIGAVSPWLGCPIEYLDEFKCFRCPCHHHEDYDLEGHRIGASPAPRDLDTLEIAVRDDEVLVKWQPTGEP